MIDQARLAECVSQLDAGTRALLDLSLRRAVPDEQVASVLGVDAASIPPRRARGIAQLADMMEVPGPSELAALLIAIPELPESAWGVPVAAPPFSGQVSRARRARAFRRTAVAASPLVALGAVIAAIAVASGSDSGGGGREATRTAAAGAAGQAATGPQASIFTPAPRHGLPPGVPLTPIKPGKAGAHAERAAARRHRLRRQNAISAERASAVRHEHATPHSEPVVFHPAPPHAPAPVPVAPPRPKHVVKHHHHTHPAPKAVPHPQHPSSAPAPVSAPAPAPVLPPVQPPPTTVHVSAPTTPVVPNSPSGDDDDHGCHGHGHGGDDGHGHDGDHGHHYGQRGEVPRGRGARFTPPGLLKHRAGSG